MFRPITCPQGVVTMLTVIYQLVINCTYDALWLKYAQCDPCIMHCCLIHFLEIDNLFCRIIKKHCTSCYKFKSASFFKVCKQLRANAIFLPQWFFIYIKFIIYNVQIWENQHRPITIFFLQTLHPLHLQFHLVFAPYIVLITKHIIVCFNTF